ncbi:hypothetical protein AAHB47_28700 [Bacillus wiedmannii]
MSEVYLKNYWLLNLEYIKVFSKLVHHNISLPLLSNFYQYLEEDIKNKMKNKDFYKYLSVAPIEEKQLQSEFEKWLPLLEQTTKKEDQMESYCLILIIFVFQQVIFLILILIIQKY